MAVEQGKVVEVHTENVGNETIQFHAANSTVIFMDDTADFDEDGGRVSINGVVYTYLSRDDDANTLTLAAPGLTTDVQDETQVLLYPLAVETFAHVIVEDGEDAIIARLPQNLAPNIISDVREDDEQESAIVELEGTEWIVRDIVAPSDKTFKAAGGGAKILDDLEDVTVVAGAIEDREVLAYDLPSQQWKPYGPIVHEGTTLPAVPANFAWQFFVKHV